MMLQGKCGYCDLLATVAIVIMHNIDCQYEINCNFTGFTNSSSSMKRLVEFPSSNGLGRHLGRSRDEVWKRT